MAFHAARTRLAPAGTVALCWVLFLTACSPGPATVSPVAATTPAAVAVATQAASSASSPATSPPPPAVSTTSTSTTTTLICEVFYLPARQRMQRAVALRTQDGRVLELLIDGQAVHTFSAQGTTLLTSQDNERMAIDIEQRTWHSQFRQAASGEGTCRLVNSTD